MTAPTGFGAQGLHPRKCLWRKGKKGLSTPRALLYYYDYVFIKTLKKKTEEQPGRRSAGPCGTPGRRWRWKRQETPALAARCGGLRGAGAFKGRQAAHNAVDDPTCWGGWRCNCAVRARPLGGAVGGGVSGAHCPLKTKAVGAVGKTGTSTFSVDKPAVVPEISPVLCSTASATPVFSQNAG